MTREEAFNLLKQKIQDVNMIKHSLAVEACLRDLALFFNQNPDQWGMAGLLHDYDYKEMLPFPEKHGLIAAEELEKLGLKDPEILHAIKAHNEKNNTPRESLLDKAIHCTDPMTGLIVAATLVLPSKKIKDLNVEMILNRYKEKRFAAGANREIIARCSELGLSLEKFSEICLKAMQKISDDLGL
ncbi:MAG: HD domain-containing protein [Minisyncoccia bacterium]